MTQNQTSVLRRLDRPQQLLCDISVREIGCTNLVLHINKSSYPFLCLQMLSMPFNPFTWDRTSGRVHSDVLTLNLKDDQRKTIKVSQLSSNISITIPLNDASSGVENPHFFIHNDTSRFHVIKVEYEDTLIQLKIAAEDSSVNLTFLMRFGKRPTIQEHDLNGTVSSNKKCIWRKIEEKVEWKRVCSTNGLTPIQVIATKPGKYYVEVKSHTNFVKPQRDPQKRQKRSCFGHGRQKRSCVEVKDPPTPPRGKNVSVVPEYNPNTDHNYTMRVALGSCVYWSDERQVWTTKGCQVSPKQGYHNYHKSGNIKK